MVGMGELAQRDRAKRDSSAKGGDEIVAPFFVVVPVFLLIISAPVVAVTLGASTHFLPSLAPLLMGFAFGTVLGQACFAGGWMAIGPGSAVWRFALTVAWLFLLALVPTAFVDFLLLLPVFGGLILLSALVQLPLWSLRLYYGVELCHETVPSELPECRIAQFGIGQLIEVTAFIAVLLGIGRALMLYLAWRRQEMMSFMVVLMLASVAVSIPVMMAALLRHRVYLAVATVLIAISLVTLAAVPFLGGVTLVSPAGVLFGTNGATAAWVLAFVASMRLCGYRLAKPL
jgi:hypothetical protein